MFKVSLSMAGRQQYPRTLSRPLAQRRKAKAGGWPLRLIWLPVSRLLLVLCPLWLAISLLLTLADQHLVAGQTQLEAVRHQLMDRNISLRAEKALLFSPVQVEQSAARLALHAPEQGQVIRIR